MGNLWGKIEKAANDAVNTIKSSVSDAGKNISSTFSDAGKNVSSTFQQVNDKLKYQALAVNSSVKNNLAVQTIKNNIAKATEPIKQKIQNFTLNTNLGLIAMAPYKPAMVALLKSKGYQVKNSDSLEKVTTMFYNNIVKGSNQVNYLELDHAEESGGNNVDWGKIIMACLAFMKVLWEKRQEKKAAEAQRRAEFEAGLANWRPNKEPETPLDVFADETLNESIPEAGNTGGFKVNAKLIIGLMIGLIVLKALIK